jgi:hypothetical protein
LELTLILLPDLVPCWFQPFNSTPKWIHLRTPAAFHSIVGRGHSRTETLMAAIFGAGKLSGGGSAEEVWLCTVHPFKTIFRVPVMCLLWLGFVPKVPVLGISSPVQPCWKVGHLRAQPLCLMFALVWIVNVPESPCVKGLVTSL